VAIAEIGRVNYTTMDNIPKGEQVLVGMFSLNRQHVVILFDSGATHDFISKAYTQKHQLVTPLPDSHVWREYCHQTTSYGHPTLPSG
jgi:hypothetical protein